MPQPNGYQPTQQVNFYQPYVADLATIRRPLNELLKKNHSWNWTKACNDAFKIQSILASDLLLTHYNPLY